LSKEFIPNQFGPAETKDPFEVSWPTFSSSQGSFTVSREFRQQESLMLKEARDRALSIEQEAYERGFEQGEKDGRELGLKRLEIIIGKLSGLFENIDNQRRTFLKTCQERTLLLTLNMGKRIFRQELLHNEEVIVASLKEAFALVTERGGLLIRLNPEDCKYLLAHSEKLPFCLDEAGGARLISDPAVTRGGCLLETAAGEVDATIESQFDELIDLIATRNNPPDTGPSVACP